MTTARHLLAVSLGSLLGLMLGPLAGLLSAPASAATPPTDPFYSSLLDEGRRAFEDGDFAAAARDLRIACFGLLEDPPALTMCLVRLGLAQAEASDKEGFFETYRRLANVEGRFQTYAGAELSPELRLQFEDWLVRLVPEAQLAAVPRFAGLAAERTAIRVRRLAPAARREEVQAQLSKRPGDVRWKLLLAEIEIEERKPAAGLAIADAVLTAEPGNGEASCVRGWALSASGGCGGAVEAFAACPRTDQDVFLAEALLRCRVSLSQWAEARRFLDALPADMLADRQLAKLAKEVERGEAKATRAEAAKPTPTPPKQDPPKQDPPKQDPPAAPADPASSPSGPGLEAPVSNGGAAPAPAPEATALSPEDRERLESAREMMGRSTRYNELAEPLALARAVADANPRSPEAQFLAAEIAYRASRFAEAVDLFRRGGDPGEDEPLLLFYFAVALFESGQREAAATTLQRSLPKLERTPFVESYRVRILGESE